MYIYIMEAEERKIIYINKLINLQGQYHKRAKVNVNLIYMKVLS
jgi:hypothetical protein